MSLTVSVSRLLQHAVARGDTPRVSLVRRNLAEAAATVQRTFPFAGYLGPMKSYQVIPEAIMRHLPPGSSILDIGSGPCSKSALLALTGYRVYACDDLADEWHLQADNRQRILEFAQRVGIEFFVSGADAPFPYRPGQFDLVMMNDILEHLHDSPLELLCQAVEWTRPGGLLLITVPNAANLRKRLALVRGRTNYPPYGQFFWSPPPWRGHVREYVLDDLRALTQYMQLDLLELRGIHRMVYSLLPRVALRRIYQTLTAVMPGARDTLLLVARRPDTWIREHVVAARPLVASRVQHE